VLQWRRRFGVRPRIFKDMQRDLQTADGDNHNAYRDQKLAQTGRPVLLRFAHTIVGAVSRPPSAS
jgi:hypothetical protein